MVKIKIDNEIYNIPKLSIEQWQECMKWDIHEKINWPKIISIATGAPIEDMRTASQDEQHIVVTMIAHEYTKRSQIQLPDFTNITFGQFIDCEVHLHRGLAQSIQNLLYTLKIEAKNAEEALYGSEKYVEFRDLIYRQYSGLFGLNDPQDHYDEDEERPVMDANQIARSWYNVLLELSEWDLLKLDQITDEPLKKVLNFMAAKKTRAIEERNQQIKKQRANELQRNRR